MLIALWSVRFAMSLMLLFLICSCLGDITQYKRIGDTDYFLVDSDNDTYDIRYYISEKDGFSESVEHSGFIKDIYWNKKYIIIKCADKDFQNIISYCIINQHSRNNPSVPWEVYEYITEKEFENAKHSLRINEKEMNYTNTNIPWKLHIK